MFAYLQQAKKEVHGKQGIQESIQLRAFCWLRPSAVCVSSQMLSDKIKHYEETKQMLNNTPAQYKSKFEWLKEVACSFKRSIEPAESL